jgi:alpha-D-ribose 1-methylphosphonate 5-triphosphate synthase subunit PhnH
LTAPTQQIDALLLASAHLTGNQSQKIFQVLLQSISRPGTPYVLMEHNLPTGLPRAIVPLLAILGYQSSFCICGDDAEMLSGITSRVTGGVAVNTAEAAYIAFLRQPDSDLITQIRRGNDARPERAAQIFTQIAAEVLVDTTTSALFQVCISGPGIDGSQFLNFHAANDFDIASFQELLTPGKRNFDMWLIDTLGKIIGIPRTANVDYTNFSTRELSK